MDELSAILISTVIANNLVLDHMLAVCPFMAASRKQEVALGMALATLLVMTTVSVISYSVDAHWLRPLGIEYLRVLVFLLVLASLIRYVQMRIRRTNPRVYQAVGVFLPLLTGNCAVLGVALLTVARVDSLLAAVCYGVGTSIGFGALLVLFAGLRERLTNADVPSPFRGAPIALVTLGLVSLAFSGFDGLVRQP